MDIFSRPSDIQVSRGESFGIALGAQAAGGYEWKPELEPTMLEYLGSDFRQTQPGIGAASEQVLKFRATGKGVVNLQLICKRPWDAAPSERRTVTVRIR
jgi:predicted secreted protein